VRPTFASNTKSLTKTASRPNTSSIDAIRKAFADKGFNEFQPDEYVSHFYNSIVPGIASSNPLTGSGSTRIKPDFWKNGIIVYNPSKSNFGRYHSRREYSHIPADVITFGGRRNEYSTLVHEMKHMQHDDAGTGINIGQYDRDLLAKAYPFDRDYWHRVPNLVSAERRAVNAQHQFRAMMDLKKKLGRLPTSEEYIKHIKGMPDVELRKYIQDPLGYDAGTTSKDIDSDRVESYRKALMSIARNDGIHMANNTSVA
jgi:hypothetical protein